ncbi:MAG: bifunctional (p)ppGpp synthetase/guanosine-3',5'-bis(diphosphate) 3'-pyrophosphohydrolase [Saprospiraceae bacterium]|nr:bifunctional (p)ppGpp synthetase/guanosine-3',5'-bis(diphosphate) 3'-pyrophosphohydrolase [Saprospiraceae bacterium]
MWNPDLYQKTLSFANHAHREQKLPGSDLPYLAHLCNVCMEAVHAVLQSRTEDINLVMQCALLHDTIEDTDLTYEDVEKEFGKPVADGVLALTKDVKLEKRLQMSDSLERILQQPPEIRIVKMADRINNLSRPPHYWTKEKKMKYQTEARLILDTLGGVNSFIETRLSNRIDKYTQYIKD